MYIFSFKLEKIIPQRVYKLLGNMNEELDTWLKSLQQVTTMSSSNKMEIWTEIKVKLVKNINIINNLILDCVPPVVVPSANNIIKASFH